MKELNIRVVVFIAIIGVVLLSLISVGGVQYLSEVKSRKQQIVDRSMISLQPILNLASRSIDGGNLMNLKNTNAIELYKTNGDLLYLKMSGMSAGTSKTEFAGEIPPIPVEYTYIKDGLKSEEQDRTKKAAEISEDGYLIDEANRVLVVHRKLNIKNGGSVDAIFSAEMLSGIGIQVFKNVLTVSLTVLAGAAVIAVFIGNKVYRTIKSHIDNSLNLKSHLDTIQQVLSNVSDAAAVVDTSAAQISESVGGHISITTQQSASVSEITSTMEELSATSMQIADNSNSVVEISSIALDDTEQGAKAVESVMVKMNEIDQNNQNNVKEIVELGKKSKEITKIMDIIDNIADQTKLIAFNAAIEASGAGESGKRFGVVAVEIRRLADNVMESTGEIKGKIEEIQETINRLVIASEKGSKKIEEGSGLASETVVMLRNMLTRVQSTVEAAKQISLSTQQQKTASSQVVDALKEIEEGVKLAAASIAQTGSTTANLKKLSENMKSIVESFKSEELRVKS